MAINLDEAQDIRTGRQAEQGAAGAASQFLSVREGQSLVVRYGGADVGARPAINLIAGTNVTLSVTDDNIENEVQITITATGSGDVSGPASSVDSEIALFSSTTGKVIKRASVTGLLKAASGVLSAAAEGADYYAPGGTDVAVADGGTGASTAAAARTNLGAADSSYMPSFARVTGANATTTSTSLVDITGLSVALAANSVYEFTASLTGNGADANGVRFGVNFSAAGASVEAGVIADTAGTGTRTRRISALNTSTAQAFFTSANDVYAVIQGVITTGANPGNLTVQHLKVTSGTSTIYVNSYLRATKIP